MTATRPKELSSMRSIGLASRLAPATLLQICRMYLYPRYESELLVSILLAHIVVCCLMIAPRVPWPLHSISFSLTLLGRLE